MQCSRGDGHDGLPASLEQMTRVGNLSLPPTRKLANGTEARRDTRYARAESSKLEATLYVGEGTYANGTWVEWVGPVYKGGSPEYRGCDTERRKWREPGLPEVSLKLRRTQR